MDFYNSIKTIHIMCAVISITGFTIRGTLKLCQSRLLEQRWIKITPHIIDTILLASAIYLAVASHQYPIQDHWLTAKVIGLLIYIGMGIMVMRSEGNITKQIFSFVIALLSAGYIVTVAISRNPLPL